MVSTFPDSPDSPSKIAPFNSLRPGFARITFHSKYEDIVVGVTVPTTNILELITGFTAVIVLSR